MTGFDVAAALQARSRHEPNRPSLRLDSVALFQVLDQVRGNAGLSWRQVARETAVNVSTLIRLQDGTALDSTTLVRLLAWLGVWDVGPFVAMTNDRTPS